MKRGFKLAIVNLTRGGMSGGYCKYLQQVLSLLQQDARISELAVFLPPEFTHLFDESQPCQDTRQGRALLRERLQAFAPDVVFIPTARWLRLGAFPTVVMVQNMEPLAAPYAGNRLPEKLKNWLRGRAARKACQQSTRIIAVSRYVRDFLVSEWQIPPHKIGLVYHGVENPPDANSLKPPVGLPQGWDRQFTFVAGSIRPARGLEDIIGALAWLRKHHVNGLLVIAGEADASSAHYQKRMVNLAWSLEVERQIHWAGQLSSAEMSWCYYHSRLFVMTSRVEACPNVALEAMSHGAFCIAADNPPLPEFFGEAALYYPPGRSDTLADTILAALSETPEVQSKRRATLRQHATQYSWQNTVERTIQELAFAVREAQQHKFPHDESRGYVHIVPTGRGMFTSKPMSRRDN